MEPQGPSPAPSSQPTDSQLTNRAEDERPSTPTYNDLSFSTASDRSPIPEAEFEPSQQSQESERHPKGKRKRTAAKDKAILEAAYHANPKPDKAARLDIVKRVSLNEKEVQIWFQNRRQNDRRKSRPLSPQEIAALRYGGMQILSSDPMTSFNSSFSADSDHTSPSHSMSQPEQFSQQEQQQQRETSPLSPGDVGTRSTDGAGKVEDDVLPTQQDVHSREEGAEASELPEAVTPAPRERENHEPGHSQSFSESVGYLSNRWNASSSFTTPSTLGHARDDSFNLDPYPPSTCSPPSVSARPILPPPRSRSSQVRLSLSLDGKAEVVSSNVSPPHLSASAPSPADLQHMAVPRRPSFYRSHSASSSSVTLPPISVLTSQLPVSNVSPLMPRLSRGRSRDVHAWESLCDAEHHEDALTVQAKHESSGSAIAAISLLRSTSSSTSGSPLQPSSSAKRNAAASRAAPRGGMAKKPRLGKSVSSVGRIQGSSSNITGLGDRHHQMGKENYWHGGTDLGATKFSGIVSPSGNDSDKENWSPDEEGASHYSNINRSTAGGGRRPLPSSMGGGATQQQQHQNPRRTQARSSWQDNSNFLLGSGRANTAPTGGNYRRRGGAGAGEKRTLDIFEDPDTSDDADDHGHGRRGDAAPRGRVVDDEVERFMRGGGGSPSKNCDADAVAGLLSLSQGNWR